MQSKHRMSLSALVALAVLALLVWFGSLSTYAETPSNSALHPDVQAIENSLLFGNPTVFRDWTQHPLTRDYVTDRTHPVFQIWNDPNSALLMSYIWADTHSVGDDFVFCPAEQPSSGPAVFGPCANPANPGHQTFFFSGGAGVCDYHPSCTVGSCGWAIDQPLIDPVSGGGDIRCQHWESALLLSENNNFQVYNLFSAMGPSSVQGPGLIGNQLTSGAGTVRPFPWYFGTETPVQSVTAPCTSTTGTVGPVNCGWTSDFVGVCSPFDIVGVQTQLNTSSVDLMVMANQGIRAGDYAFSSGGKGASDGNFLGSGGTVATTTNPSFSFRCPPSGTFNIQWAPYNRSDTLTPPPNFTFSQITAASPSAFPPVYPADELDIFKRSNREGYFAGNLFTDINPSLYQCEVRVNQPICGGNTNFSGARLCNPNVAGCCVPCERGLINFATLPDGSQVPTNDVAVGGNMPSGNGNILGGAQDYWASQGVSFQGTGMLVLNSLPGGNSASTNDDGWCPTQANNYTCSGNNIAVTNSVGNDPANGTPTVDTLRIHFASPQAGVAFDIDNGYLALSPQTTVQLKAGGNLLDTLTLVESCPSGGCPPNTIPEIAPCPNQSSLQLCGRFQLSDSGGNTFDEIDVLPTTVAGANAACTITTSGHAGNCGTSCGSNYDANCGGSLVDNVTIGDFTPLSNTVVFLDAHSWFEPTFGTKTYAAKRSCSSNRSSCIADYQGSISTGPAPCTNLSLDVDTANPLPYPGAARQLFDVGGCSFANFASSSPTPAIFTDPVNGSYPAYGVTSFSANYGTGVDGIGVSCSPFNQAPTATASACIGNSCGSSITVAEKDGVTLDGTGSTDPDGDPLAYTWSEATNLVAPSVSQNPQYTFSVPVGTAGQTLSLSLTASDPCYRVSHSGVSVKVKSNTSTTLASSVNPSGVGQSVTFTATVSCAGSCSGAPTPIGTVSFVQTSGPAVTLSGASGTLDSSGQAKVTATGATTTFSLQAAYGGDANFTGSTGTLKQNVTLDPTTTTVSFSTNPVILRQPVTITASVTTSGLGTPNSGTVTFFDGSTQLGSPVTVNSSGVATLTTSTLAIGAHSIKASYSGDGAKFTASSGTATLNVSYQVVAEYDQTKASNSGGTIPIKVQLQDFAGKNLSSSSISLTLTATPVLPSPAPGAQPSGTFTFMSNSNTGPGYQYNLKTTNFPKNTYKLSFTATGDPVVHQVGFVLN